MLKRDLTKRRLRKQSEKQAVKPRPSIKPLLNNYESDDLVYQIEYVSAQYDDDNSLAKNFRDVFEKLNKTEFLMSVGADSSHEQKNNALDEVVSKTENTKNDTPKLSKKKKKLMTRLSVAELKQMVPRSDVVEAHDVTSSDPRLLVYLKSYRNTVQIPRHWCHKRKYLQGKRGVEKVPFQLPEFIAETGIAKIRETVMEQEALKKSKQKARERVKPKMGKIDIDYQVLHDAFFKYQTKPKLTMHGDLYYEGKEFEVFKLLY
jgi:splicing factor 3B subunit 2